MVLTNRVRELRLARGASLADVANAIGMDRAQLHRVERGIAGCADEKKLLLAEYFGVGVADLFFQRSVGEVSPTGAA